MDRFLKNARRFSGFADIYNQARPQMPVYPIEVIERYLHKKAGLIVDLGCGTGLSTAAWKNHCRSAIGIDPRGDRLAAARARQDDTLSFRQAFSHHTSLPGGCADVVICSQSFHWMDPVLTLAEVHRILCPEGIFAAVDYDWPPVCRWEAESAHLLLSEAVRQAETDHPDLQDHSFRTDKSRHLLHIRESGYFRYSREILFANREFCDGNRYIDLALSRGGLQNILRKEPDLIRDALDQYIAAVRRVFGQDTLPVDFCYRMRIGIQ